jgi:hypothetical protein
MKKLGISIDGVIRDYLDAFDKQYRKVFIHNPSIVNMSESFEYQSPNDQEIEELAHKIEKDTADRISLPMDTFDLLNHYQFDETPEFAVENAFEPPTSPNPAEFNEYMMETKLEDKILTPQMALEKFMYEKYPFKIFGDSEEFQNATSYFNQIQAFGLKNNLFETVLFSDLKANAIPANFYFMHKVGCRARNFRVVSDNLEKWNYCDVLVDVIPEVFQNKPEGKISIKIDTLYNQWDETDYTIKSLKELNNEVLLKKLFE